MKRSTAIASAALLVGLTSSFALAQTGAKPDKKPAAKETAQPTKEKEATVTLKVGDAAPALKIDKWVKGESVHNYEKDKVYVVEFWATWCPPCRESIPHLTELQKKYKDVVFIGVDGSEHVAADKKVSTIEKFVKEQGEKMDYRVAYDASGAMVKAFLTAAGQNGIPTAFLIDGHGKIAWIGHPMDKLDEEIGKIAKATPAKAAPAKTEKPKGKG